MKYKIKKRFISLVLLILVVFSSVLSLSSCALKYDEAEVIAAAESLIKSSEKLNEIYFGRGIAYSPDLSSAEGVYYRADAMSCDYFGVNTIAELEELTRKTFTVRYANNIISTKLKSISDEDGIQIYARYYQKTSSLDDKTPECIMVYRDAEVLLTDRVTYDYTSLAVSRVDRESLFVTLNVKVISSLGEAQDSTLEVELMREAGGWRINSPTYKRYNSNDAYYNELQNKK